MAAGLWLPHELHPRAQPRRPVHDKGDHVDHDALIKLSRRSHGNRVNDAFLRMLETHKAAQRSEPAYVQHLMFPLLGDPVGLGAAWKAAWVLTQMGYTVDIHEVESALWEYEMRVSLRPIAGLA